MSMSSHHTKEALEALHPNIACMVCVSVPHAAPSHFLSPQRHPDHIGSKNDVEFWSHHEKVRSAPSTDKL